MDLAQHHSWVNGTSCGWLAKCRSSSSANLAGMVYNIISSYDLVQFSYRDFSLKNSTMWLFFGDMELVMIIWLVSSVLGIEWLVNGFSSCLFCAHKMTGLKIATLTMLIDAPESTFYLTLTKGEPSWQLSPTTILNFGLKV
jgi:hypothetical protein